MRNLFNFIYDQRHTLLFLLLLLASFFLLFNKNNHHRAWYISTSNELTGNMLTFRSDVRNYMDLKQENDRLRTENANARSRHKSAYSPVESKLVRIQDSIYQQVYRYQEARVVNSTFSKQQNFLTLNRGLKKGLAPDMGVLGHNGVIGIVKQSSENYAVAMSILNTQLQFSVEIERTGHFGLYRWDTNDPTIASVIDVAKHAPVQKGDQVITRGSGGVFPRGVVIGEVVDVISEPGTNYLDIKMKLMQDMTRTAHAYVVMNLHKMEQDSLENLVDQW